jgi:hypothetical protein
MIDTFLADRSPQAEENLISYAKLLLQEPLNSSTVPLYFKLFSCPYPSIAQVIFQKKKPESFFSILDPSRELIIASLEILTQFRCEELSPKILAACLGILESAYKNPHLGFSLYPIRIAELHHLGKYLLREDMASHDRILDLLDYLGSVPDRIHRAIGEEARKIKDAYLDNKKILFQIIPKNLL